MENVNIRTTDKFIEITPIEGYVITSWDKNDIMDYGSTTMLVTPLNYDYSMYYTISVDEDTRLVAEQENKIKEIENN